MGNSLSDQLLKAGLVNNAKAKKVRSDKHKSLKQQRKHKIETVNETKEQFQKQQQLKVEKDRELNRQIKEQAEKTAVLAQIKQLIDLNKLPQEPEGTAFNFSDGSKVKTLYLSDSAREYLVKGRLAIVRSGQSYQVIPAGVAEKIQQRDATLIVMVNEPDPSVNTVDDDPYADYKIPDDLIW
ncbi:MAG: DUF2058 domain-containing protein [Methylococcales bacterium]|jgi:hypothetical protein|nr:DUF2058 domain-containing protein [Methylococcales bacterium]MBT3507532.1 DUF2058 domain-containing protein [Methylococcales bacterium]MBT3699229.1 DUF2058 domain-containing protein [Methylococcales bacterium]MBT3815766.1 DUF2058 domain-containing protein [Methylococcales bacterium]MBT4031683.1 DUF2058 domain-containing protein [Methylococcales bacterium]